MTGRITGTAVLAAALLIVACSDDNGTPTTDALVVDAALKDEGMPDTGFTPADAPPPQEKTVSTGDVSLRVHIAGNLAAGEVLLALNGGPGMSSDYMTSLDQLASGSFAVVRFDQRGCGKSTKPANKSYSAIDYMADIEAVRQAVVGQSGKVHVLGHSWGGFLAMAYAATHGQHVKSLVLSSSMPVTRAEFNTASAKFDARVKQLQQQGLIPDPYDPFNFDDFIVAYFADPTFSPPAELQGATLDKVVLQETMSALGPYDISKEVNGITAPALVLFGDGEPFGVEMGQSGYNALTGTTPTWVLLKACGHFWQECPTEFFKELRSFYKLGS